MKRWNFGGLRATHGVSVSHRSHGSTGQRQDPGKVFKGKKMAGHLGDERVTTQNLEVVRIDAERGLIFVRGAVPGAEQWLGRSARRREGASAEGRAEAGRPPRQGRSRADETPRRQARRQEGRLRSISDAVFGIAEIRPDILQRMVSYQLAKRRAGTHKTQNRDEVSVTHQEALQARRARAARVTARRNAPIFVGGGVAHGPHPHGHAHDLPKKVRALALQHALSSKVKDEALIVLDALTGEKTKDVSAQLKKLGISNALVIGGAKLDEKFARPPATSPTSTCCRTPASTSTTSCAARRWC